MRTIFAPPQVSPGVIFEGDDGIVETKFMLERAGDLSQASLAFLEIDGVGPNPTDRDDFDAVNKIVNFGVGESSKTISFPVLGDTTFEADETFEIRLVSVTEGYRF